jgi:biotin transport system ATP-binding protein
VEEDLAFGLKNLRLPPADIAARVTAALRRHDLEGLRHHPAHLLSGGQKQLLALSSVLVMEPRYIVFDEPTTLLDLRNKRRLAQAIHALPQTAIVVSHDLELLHDFDRVLVFEAGRIVADDVPAVALDAYVRSMT